jgi:hypothetical protein
LLIQLFGCYSLREIPVEELYNGEEARITTKDSVNYLLRKDLTSDEVINNPDFYCSNDWSINPKLENINIIYKKAYNKDGESDKLYFEVDTTNIKYTEIRSVSAQRINVITTGVAIVLSVGLIVLAVTAIRESMEFDLKIFRK